MLVVMVKTTMNDGVSQTWRIALICAQECYIFNFYSFLVGNAEIVQQVKPNRYHHASPANSPCDRSRG